MGDLSGDGVLTVFYGRSVDTVAHLLGLTLRQMRRLTAIPM